MTSAASLTLPIHIAELALVVRRSRFEQSRCGQGTRARADRASVPRMKSILGQSPQPNQAIGFSRWRPVAKSPFSRRGAHTLIAVALLASTLLTGCSSTPAPTPTPTALIAGKFATEEEALAAAEERFREYALLSDLAVDEVGLEKIRPLVTDSLFEYEETVLGKFSTAGIEVRGTLIYSNFVLSDSSRNSVTIHFCSDASGTRVFNSAGIDVTPEQREAQIAMQSVLIESNGRLIVDSVDAIGTNSCDG